MKRGIILILLSFVCGVCCFAQHQGHQEDRRVSDYFFRQVGDDFRSASDVHNLQYNPVRSFLNQNYYQVQWHYVDLSRNCCVMKSFDEKQFFAGKVRRATRRSNGKVTTKVMLSGKGIMKKITNDKAEFILGTWRRDLLTGKSINRDTTGKFYVCIWKYGEPVKESLRDATNDEMMTLSQEIISLDTKIDAAGLR